VVLDLPCLHPQVSSSFLIHLLLLLLSLWLMHMHVSCGYVFEWFVADVGTLIDDVVTTSPWVVKQDSVGQI